MEQNKRNAMAFYELMFNQSRPQEAIERTPEACTSSTTPTSAMAERRVEYFERMAQEYPGKRVEFIRAFAEGDHVVLHCRQTWPGDQVYAGIDIFRFDESDMIAEHWDVLQLVPESSANDNTMF